VADATDLAVEQWLQRNWPAVRSFLLAPSTVIGLAAFSLACCALSLLVATWAVRRLPVDYLSREPECPARVAHGGVRLLRNGIGLLLLLLGLLMLILPGQGVLTVVAALAVMDFRSKRRVEHWLMSAPRVLGLINRLRLRSGHPPLRAPEPKPVSARPTEPRGGLPQR